MRLDLAQGICPAPGMSWQGVGSPEFVMLEKGLVCVRGARRSVSGGGPDLACLLWRFRRG